MAKLETAIRERELPAVLGDYSDRSGNAAWILGEFLKRDIGNSYIASIRDPRALDLLARHGAKAGDPFDGMVDGYGEAASGVPVRVRGTVAYIGPGPGRPDRIWAAIRWGRNNLIWLSPQLEQFTDPDSLRFGGIEPDDYEIFVLKSRVHFRRRFDDSGYAKTVLLVEPEKPYLGTVHLGSGPINSLAEAAAG